METFPPIDQLPTHRIQKKLCDGVSPTHISLWLAYNTMAQQLNSYSEQTPEEFIEEMCCNLILNMDEKDEILNKMSPNRPLRGFEHFCKCLRKKDVDDVRDFLDILFRKSSLIPLVAYLRSVIQRCEEIQRSPANRDTFGSEVHHYVTIKLIIPPHCEVNIAEAIRKELQEFIDKVAQREAEVTSVNINSIILTFKVKDTWDVVNIQFDISSGAFQQRFIFWLEDMGTITAEENRSVTAEITAISRETQVNRAKDCPPSADYLDCKQTQDGAFLLKWHLPQMADVPITNSVLEMKDESGEWKPLYGPFQGSSFLFQGAAVEFRVAAVNEFGIGVYTYCTPSPELSIHPPLQKDRAELQSDILPSQPAIASSAVSELHSSYLRPGIEERTLGVLNITCGSTTIGIPQPEPQPTAGSTTENRQRHYIPPTKDSRNIPHIEVQEQSILLDLLTPDQKKSQPGERFFGRLLGHIPSINRLGANLGMGPTEIQDCVVEVPNSVDGQAYYMLFKWKEKQGRKATVKKLLIALQHTDIPEESYRNAVLDYFNDSDSD